MKIFFVPMDAHGHVNSCVGLALMLKEFGHECIFSLPARWIKTVAQHGFSVETIVDPNTDENEDLQKKWGTFMRKHIESFGLTPREQFQQLIEPASREFIQYVKIIDDQLPDLFYKVKPDLILIDFYVALPAVIKSGRPWMLLFSCNPLKAYERPDVPPGGFGLSIRTDPSVSMELKMFMSQIMAPLKTEFDGWLKSKDVVPDQFTMMILSPYLNVYSFPSDLDYTELGPVPNKWFRLDHMVRKTRDEPLGIDESFFDRPEKKVYFSLGSMGAADIDLMKRLIAIFAKSKHLFIVSKGLYHDRIELADNMTGAKFLNQLAIIPRVDLVIHHGGNNSFVETVYFGKPFIVLPLFGDQHDNGRRAEDTKTGRSFLPHSVTEAELLQAIDELLNDKELQERVKKIGENVRNSRSIENFNQKIIELTNARQEA